MTMAVLVRWSGNDRRRARELGERRTRQFDDLGVNRESENEEHGGEAGHVFDILTYGAYISNRWSDLGPLATSLKKAKLPPFRT